MARSLKETASVLVFPEHVSEQSAEMFIRDLKEHLNDTTSEQTVIDCSKIPKLSTLQTDLLNQIAGLCKDANVQLRLDSEQIGLTDYLRAICEDNNSDVLVTNESSAPRTVVAGQVGCPATEFRDDFHPTVSELHSTALKLDGFVRALECDLQTRYAIKTIFYEIVTNIRLYSGMKQEEKIKFRTTISEAAVTMTFIDSGRRFDISKAPNGPCVSAEHEEERLSFGIHLIKTLSDKIEYSRSEESENIVIITYGRNKK